ncbi:MAG: YcxB family protein [Bacteroidetes bacterium]|nr:YcxB family protein [Bacteroidota bacterium]
MTLNEDDYLTFQLYTASKTPRVKKARIRSWILTTITFLCLAYLFYHSDNDFLTIYFLVIAGLSLTLFPFYTRWRYKRHYLKYIRDTYKTRFGEKCELEFTPDAIVTKDKSGEVKINKSEINEINEIKDFYFLKTSSGMALIISKSKTEDIEKIKSEIKSLVETGGVKHNIELDWKWR